MNAITFNVSRGEALMERLYEAYKVGYGVHQYRPETHAPQHLFIPEKMRRGGLKWRQWMARAAGTDYRTQSMNHYENHAKLRIKHPPLYTCEAARYSPAAVGYILEREGFGKWRSMAKHLPVLAHTLAQEFGDDPVNFYRDGSIDAFLKAKMRFERTNGYEGLPGFGPKISSLFAMFLEEEGLVKIGDAFPVDVWVQQIFIATRIITLHENTPADVLENDIRLFLCELCARRGWERVDLAHALWFLGNRGCRVCHNSHDMELACSMWHDCGGKVASDSYRLKGLWTPDAVRYRKGGSRVFRLEPIPSDSPQKPLFEED